MDARPIPMPIGEYGPTQAFSPEGPVNAHSERIHDMIRVMGSRYISLWQLGFLSVAMQLVLFLLSPEQAMDGASTVAIRLYNNVQYWAPCLLAVIAVATLKRNRTLQILDKTFANIAVIERAERTALDRKHAQSLEVERKRHRKELEPIAAKLADTEAELLAANAQNDVYRELVDRYHRDSQQLLGRLVMQSAQQQQPHLQQLLQQQHYHHSRAQLQLSQLDPLQQHHHHTQLPPPGSPPCSPLPSRFSHAAGAASPVHEPPPAEATRLALAVEALGRRVAAVEENAHAERLRDAPAWERVARVLPEAMEALATSGRGVEHRLGELAAAAERRAEEEAARGERQLEVLHALRELLQRREGVGGGLASRREAAEAEGKAAALQKLRPVLGSLLSTPRAGMPRSVSHSEPLVRTPRHVRWTDEEAARAVVCVLASKSGFAAEMIEMSHELERDLAIDSIKRVEIVSEVQRRFSFDSYDAESLARAQTVREMVAILIQHLERSATHDCFKPTAVLSGR
ncbi:hypothetical protein AB1Y20_018609 [Prymnesium parvum]|uniref:Carrier domain-containing protein n=1 Tax=Prymnesium parvum TaxID=97485 RepID=A0AB34JSQ3_PRYPA